MLRASLPLALALALSPLAPARMALAQAPPSESEVSVILVEEGGVSRGQLTVASMGLRRGLRAVEGVRYRHPVDRVSESFNEDVQYARDSLESLPDQVRTGDAQNAYERADEVTSLLENNLSLVRRRELIDAYMLAAVARCRAGRTRACARRFRDLIAFRENLEYDAVRYGPESEAVFSRARERALGGPRGALLIETEPPGVEVYVDGRSFGPSPARAEDLLAGRHYVTVKELGFARIAVSVTVSANRQTRASYTLEESVEARRIMGLLPGVRGELGQARAGPNLHSLAQELGTNQTLVGVVRPSADSGIHLQLYLYHAATQLMQAQREVTVPTDPIDDGVSLLRDETSALFEGVDMAGGIEAPEDDMLTVDAPPELYEQWWFWVTTVGGAAIIGGAIAAGVVLSGGAQVPGDFIRFQGDFP